MRKIFFLSLLFLSILLVPNASNATHIMGGEITWECDANGRYDFRVSVYRDCSGNAVPVRGHLYIHNYPSVGVVTLIAKNNNPAGATNTSDIYSSVVGDTIKPNCRTGATYICGNGGGDPEAVFVENIEVNNVKLNGRPPLGGWIITYSDVARNPNDNISGQPGITLRAKMFSSSATVNDTCVDNSPVFREEATSLLCLGSAFTYNHNASDAELDSLVYEWARPLGDLSNSNRDGFFGNPDPLPSLFVEGSTPSNVGFDFRTGGTGRYTFDSPFPNSSQDVRNVAAVLDQNTGEISLECYTSGKYVSVVKVSAYKCGEKVAEIYRELQSNINANCATLNNEPTIRPPFLDPSNNFTLFNDTVNAGDLVTFNIQVTDFDFITDSSVIPPVIRFDTVTLEASGLQFGTNYTSSTTGCPNPPCATLTSSLPQSSQSGVNSSFRWQTDCNHVAFSDGCVSLSNTYTFVVRATDNSCPIPAQNIATISVTVLADSVIQSPLINCLDVKNNGDVELDWNTTPNIGNSFTAWMIYSATNKNGPYSLVDSVKTYNTTTYTHVGANADDQQRWYFMRSRSGCKGQIQNVSRDTVSTIFVDFQENNADLDVIWNPLGDPNPVGSSNQYRVSKAYPVTGGLSFYQNTMDTTINETFAVCSDTVQYRVELVNTAEACTSRSNLAGFRFEFAQPQTNFSFPANPCPNTSIAFTNLTTISSGTITYSWDFDDGSPVSTTENPSHTFTLPGSYDVTLTATSSLGCDSIFIQTLDVDFPDADAGTDIAICTAGSTQIGGSPTTTAGNTITWSPATGLSSTSVANPTATPTTTTTYTVTVTEPSGCSNTDQITVTVNSIPTADAGLDQTICSGDNASLGGSPTGPVGATYEWDNVASLSSGTAANPTATPTATTAYSVTVTSGVNCTATDQVTITVDPLPTADAGLDQTICDGDNAVLGGSPTGPAGATYQWDNTASLSSGTVANPTATPSTTTTYTVTVTDGTTSCTETDQVTVTVNPIPVADAGADASICIGDNTTLGGSPTGPVGSTYQWDNTGSLSSGTVANPTATPTATTTYSVTVTSGANCTSTDQVTITVDPLPTADAGVDQTICNGDNATLGGSPTGPAGATYQWDNTGSLSSGTVANPTATPSTTTTYTVTVTDGTTSCTETDQVTITVNPLPATDAGLDASICIGDNTIIGGSPTGPVGATYQWDNTGSLSSGTVANPTATPTTTTTYTVTVTDGTTSCTSTDQVTVTVNPLPVADAGLDQTICSGDNASLGGSPTGPVGATYQWDNVASLSSGTAANPTATPTATTTYSVTVTSGVNCTATDQVTITVDPLPTADAGLDQTICDGDNAVLGGSPTGPAGATYQWDNTASLSSGTVANPTATPSTTTTYTVTVTDGTTSCTETDQVTVTVNPIPVADAGADASICIGDNTTLGGSPTGPVGSTYQWDNTGSLSSGTVANPTATPTATTTYSVTVTSGANCTSTDQVTITVDPLPTADAGVDQTICNGDNATLGGSPTGPAGATYQWDNTGSLSSGTVANPTATPSTTTTYTVTVTDGTTSCTETDQVTITVNPLPATDAGLDASICIGDNTIIGGSPTGPTGATYQWDNTGSLSSGTVANPTATPTTTTTYTVTVTDGTTSCTSTDQVTVTVNPLPVADAGLDQTICSGDNASLGGSPTGPVGATYQWDNVASLSSGTAANPTATPTATTTYSVTVTSGVNCTATDQVTITVDPLPTADAGVDQTICDGDNAVLGGSPSGPAGATYQWNNTASLSSGTVANPTATPSTTTTYTVTVTDGTTSCTETDQVTVTVNPIPVADAGADASICIGDNTTLGGSPTGPVGSTYQWDNTGSLSSGTVANPTATPTATTTYSVTVTSGANCTSTDQVTITVDPLPTADAGVDQTICNGDNATLGGSPTGPVGATYQWDNTGSLSSGTVANPTATPSTTTTYTVTVTDGTTSCTVTDQVTITVNPLPATDAGLDASICIGDNTIIGGSPTGPTGATYQWDNTGSLSSGTVANPTATPTTTTTYTVTVTDGTTSCTSTDQVTVTVNPLPVADAGLDQTICSGDNASLGGSPTGPVGATYEWDNVASLSSGTAANPTATPTATTAYSVTVTSGVNCTATDQVTITVDPLPTADAGLDQTICDGDNAVLGGSPTGPAGATYQWDNTASLSSGTVANPTATPSTTTTYTVTVTDGTTSCTETDQVTVTVNPIPVADAGADASICIGDNTTLGGSPTGPVGSTYQWDNTGSLSSGTVANPTATPTATTTYSVTVTSGANCTSTDQVTITVDPLPTADAGVDQTICNGDNATLGGSPTGPAGATYQWDNTGSLSSGTVANPTATPSTTTTYTVTVTDGTTSCTETDQVTITVNPLPATDAGLDASICIGDNTTIGGSPTGPVGATYQWDNTGSLSSGTVANPTATPTTTTTYTVTVTDGTTSCTSTDQVTVTVNPLPVADAGADRTICELDTTILGTPAVIGGSYQWDNSLSLDDATIAEPRAFPLATTTYSVTVTDANGCSAIDQVVVTVNTTPNVDAGIDLTICSGDTVTIGGTPTSTNTDATYSWDNVASLDDNLLANPRAFPTDTTIYVVTVTDAAGCTSTDTMRVNVNPLPQAAFEVDALCEGDFTAFTDRSTIAVGTINSWSWDFGDGLGTSNLQNAAYQYPTSGIYDVKLKVTTASGCIDSTEESITVNPIALANAGADRTICFGDTAKLGGNPTGLPGSNFSWSPSLDLNNVSISNPLAFPLSTTNYFLSVTDQNGCVNFDTVEVSVNPLPNIIASNDVSVCVNEAVQLSASGGVSYKWSPAKWLDDPLSANPIANPFKNIDYIVEGTDANGCTETDTVKVEVFNVDFNPPDTSICFGTDIQLNPIIEGDENGISFQWTPSNSLNDGNIRNPLASPMFVEEYRLQIENNAGCLDADSVTINILPRAGLDFTYLNSPRCSGAVLEIENNSTSSERYEWWLNGSFAGSEEEPKFRIDNLKENTLQLIGYNGECSDTLTEIIPAASFMELLQLKDANVFTPNGDGINDLFDPGFEGEFIGCVGFVIYDRWGKKVFDSNIGQYGWDGVTLEGERAKNGTYYYIINIAGEEIKGSVYLSR